MRVKEVASISGVSVRTLHHYDQIGLLRPDTTEAGYREYDREDLARLQQILYFKELGFSLKQIGELLDSPSFDRLEALHMQRQALLEKQERIHRMIESIDKTMKDEKGELDMKHEERFIGFDFSENPYEEEAKKRWGTEAVELSKERVTALSKGGKRTLEQDLEALFSRLAGLMKEGPESEKTQAAIDEWYHYLNKIGTYSLDAFKGLGVLYVQDPRFKETMDQKAKGFSEFMQDAMAFYADSRLKN